jgi:hypothetical protein
VLRCCASHGYGAVYGLGKSRNLREQEALAEEFALKLLPKLNTQMVSMRD